MFLLLKNRLVEYRITNITVIVATKLVSIFKDTIAPNEMFGLKADSVSTRKPKITTTALNEIALPE